MEVVNLRKTQIRQASEVLAASFFDYPMFTFYFPDVGRRKKNLPWYFRNILNCAFRYGEVLTNQDVSGVIFTLPPGHTRITLWEYVQNGFLLTPLKLGIRNYIRSMECEAFVEEAQERLMGQRQRIYLWGLAVAPGQKRKGVGSTLLKRVIDRADREKLPIYLETHDESNLTYYRRYGFDLISAEMIHKFDLPFWCMLRELCA